MTLNHEMKPIETSLANMGLKAVHPKHKVYAATMLYNSKCVMKYTHTQKPHCHTCTLSVR